MLLRFQKFCAAKLTVFADKVYIISIIISNISQKSICMMLKKQTQYWICFFQFAMKKNQFIQDTISATYFLMCASTV
jgi:hypothetical protein